MSAEGGLNGYMLNAAQRREKERRGWDESIVGLTELIDDGYVGPAAREALRCVRDADADPRLLLLIVEAAQEGFFAPTTAQLAHNRRIAAKGGTAKAERPRATGTAPIETTPSSPHKEKELSDAC